MAQFIPPIDTERMEFDSEALIARAMQERLGPGFIVMHSLPWMDPARDDIDAPAREGDRTVTYNAGGKKWTVTFVKGTATEVKAG